jgi:hypothetical protein
MTDERLADIRTDYAGGCHAHAVGELLAEVDRLRSSRGPFCINCLGKTSRPLSERDRAELLRPDGFIEPAKAEPAQMSEARIERLIGDAIGKLTLGISAGVLRLDRDDSGESDAISVISCADIIRNALEDER